MYKKHLVIITIALAWVAVLFFMLGFGKDDEDYILIGSVINGVVAVCVLWIIFLITGKSKSNKGT